MLNAVNFFSPVGWRSEVDKRQSHSQGNGLLTAAPTTTIATSVPLSLHANTLSNNSVRAHTRAKRQECCRSGTCLSLFFYCGTHKGGSGS